jgi:hypothetical protein
VWACVSWDSGRVVWLVARLRRRNMAEREHTRIAKDIRRGSRRNAWACAASIESPEEWRDP